jgi:hypothetical protein
LSKIDIFTAETQRSNSLFGGRYRQIKRLLSFKAGKLTWTIAVKKNRNSIREAMVFMIQSPSPDWIIRYLPLRASRLCGEPDS